MEEEYQHYRWFYPETIIDEINRARGTEQTCDDLRFSEELRPSLRKALRATREMKRHQESWRSREVEI